MAESARNLYDPDDSGEPSSNLRAREANPQQPHFRVLQGGLKDSENGSGENENSGSSLSDDYQKTDTPAQLASKESAAEEFAINSQETSSDTLGKGFTD